MKNQKEVKVIDFDLTISDFFKSVISFLEKQKQKARTSQEYLDIAKNIKRINKIASNPRLYSKYGPRIENGLEPDFAGFVRYSLTDLIDDNRKILAFENVLDAIDGYYNGSGYDKEKNLLMAIKRWSYAMSNSLFKDLTLSFKSLESFASRRSIGKQR